MTGTPEDVPLARRIADELPGVRAYLRRIAGRGMDVDDLVQDTAARALKYAGSFDGERDLGRWLRGVALRTLIDQRARKAAEPLALEAVPEAGATPRDQAELREDVARVLARVSDVERDVLVRFHAREESVRDIAAALGIAEGTVKSHLYRARRRIRGEEGS
jgi:RNA polymerase sigma-70 factor (ECF subfamily)